MRELIKKYITIPGVRRAFQGSIIFLIFFAPFSQIIRTFRQDPHPYPESPLYGNFIFNWFIDLIDHPLRNFLKYFYDDITGGPYALKIYFLHLAEPLTATVNTFTNLFYPALWDIYMIFSFAIPLVFAVTFGRVYCGYVCPMSAIVSMNIKLQNKFFKRKIAQTSASPSKQPRWNSYFFYILLAAVFIQPLILQYILPPSAMQHAAADHILYGGITLWGVLLLAVLLFEFYKPSYFCRHLCPTGLFLNRLGEKRILQIGYVQGNKCDRDCSLCNDVCWLGLNPRGHADDPACDLCHRCVEICPQDRLKINFRKKYFRTKKPAKTPAKIVLQILAFLFFSPVLFQDHLNAQSDPGYVNPALYTTLLEQETKSNSDDPSEKIKIIYSVIAPRQFEKGDNAFLHIHIAINDKFYTGMLNVEISSEGKTVQKTGMDGVNFPISIRNPSIYRIVFPFEKYRKYNVAVNVLEKKINSFTFDFRYPSKRF